MDSRDADTKHYLGIRLSLFALTLRLKNSSLSIDLAYLLTCSASFFGFLKDFLDQLSPIEKVFGTIRRVLRANTQLTYRTWCKGGKSSFGCIAYPYIAYHHSVGNIHLCLIGGPFVCFPTKKLEVLAAGSILEFFDVRIVAGLGLASDEQTEKQEEG